MNKISFNSLSVCILIFIFFNSGCSFVSKPANFYLLTPIADNSDKSHQQKHESFTKENWIIGVGPIALAKHLQRKQIISRTHIKQLQIEEFERWAEELDDNISSVISENLGTLMNTKVILIYPWNETINLDYQIEINIRYFTVDENNNVKLIAVWSILDTKNNKLFHIKRSEIISPVMGNTINDQINAQNQALLDLRKNIANQFVNEE
ncbi:MAG: PqiC family protein [Thiohalomonas sp.]|nr:PqiC family protein [Thiohalomonas sp.]